MRIVRLICGLLMILPLATPAAFCLSTTSARVLRDPASTTWLAAAIKLPNSAAE